MSQHQTNGSIIAKLETSKIKSSETKSPTRISNEPNLSFREVKSNPLHNARPLNEQTLNNGMQKQAQVEISMPHQSERDCVVSKKNKATDKKQKPHPMSKIPLATKESCRQAETNTKPAVDIKRSQGAIPKKTKAEAPLKQIKSNIPTKINNSKLQKIIDQGKQNIANGPLSMPLNSGDIIDDVLYISGPLKKQNVVPNMTDQTKTSIQNNAAGKELQSFQLIAPDNFMIYQALSTNHNINSTKPLEQKIADFKKELKSTSTEQATRVDKSENHTDNNMTNNLSSCSSQQHSLEEGDPTPISSSHNIRPLNEVSVSRIELNQRKDSTQFNSGKCITVFNFSKVCVTFFILTVDIN